MESISYGNFFFTLFQCSHFSRPHRHNDVRYSDFVVAVSDIDKYFILQLLPILVAEEEAFPCQRSSPGDNSISHDRLHSRQPNFSFLGQLHAKLMQPSNTSLSDYITQCQQGSEEIMSQAHGRNKIELLRTEEERELMKLFPCFHCGEI